MEWDEDKQDRELFHFYQKMISLRKENEMLRTGGIRFLYAKKKDKRLAFERWSEDGRMLILINNSKKAQTIKVPVENNQWLDVDSGGLLEQVKGFIEVQLPAYGFQILKADTEA
jgi:cyclomaltodextrinase